MSPQLMFAEYQPNSAAPVSSSAVAISQAQGKVYTPSGGAYDYPVPRALEISEISGIVKAYADGARNSIAAGMPSNALLCCCLLMIIFE